MGKYLDKIKVDNNRIRINNKLGMETLDIAFRAIKELESKIEELNTLDQQKNIEIPSLEQSIKKLEDKIALMIEGFNPNEVEKSKRDYEQDNYTTLEEVKLVMKAAKHEMKCAKNTKTFTSAETKKILGFGNIKK